MKISTLIYLAFTILILSACQKDDSEKSGQRLRIKKIADNVGMEGADIFNYDTNSNLVSIQNEGYSSKTTIEYNSKGQPIKINKSDNYVYTIEWNNDGFVVTSSSGGKNNSTVDTYILNSNGQVKSCLHTYNTSSYKYNFNWIKEDSLVVLGRNPTESFKLTKINSCFKGVNIAVMQILELAVNYEMVDYQNLYCPSIYKGWFYSKITYDVNKQNYPTRAVLVDYDDPKPWYMYYVYETY